MNSLVEFSTRLYNSNDLDFMSSPAPTGGSLHSSSMENNMLLAPRK